jgi:hypothetical protein
MHTQILCVAFLSGICRQQSDPRVGGYKTPGSEFPAVPEFAGLGTISDRALGPMNQFRDLRERAGRLIVGET